MRILLTNDDGVGAPGLQALEAGVRARYPSADGNQVVTVAPAFHASGASRAITITRPVRCEPVGTDRYALDGTPADCVLWAVKRIFQDRIDLVISGINHGPNLGYDIAFSGTCAAALEGARFGFPALALSLAADQPIDFAHAVAFALDAAPRLVASPLPVGVALSANIPPGKPLGIRVTKPGRRVYSDFVLEREDPFGRPYYWLAGDGRLSGDAAPGTDIAAIEAGYISVTPLDSDFHAPYTDVSSWEQG